MKFKTCKIIFFIMWFSYRSSMQSSNYEIKFFTEECGSIFQIHICTAKLLKHVLIGIYYWRKLCHFTVGIYKNLQLNMSYHVRWWTVFMSMHLTSPLIASYRFSCFFVILLLLFIIFQVRNERNHIVSYRIWFCMCGRSLCGFSGLTFLLKQ